LAVKVVKKKKENHTSKKSHGIIREDNSSRLLEWPWLSQWQCTVFFKSKCDAFKSTL